ncbi:MAG: hypothetical protein IJF90_06830 [Synergistaceae bacterium]|nr:hypothetical protein [Synergistaceae bacterium]
MSWSLPRELEPLKKFPHWVAWELKVDPNNPARLTKPPIDPRTGRNAKANDARTWATFDEALSRASENARKQGLSVGMNHGVGFEFGVEPCGYAGIDLDHVIQQDGTLKPFAREIVDLMDSYTEYSPSGKGLHILFELKVPLSEIGSRNKNDDIGLEIYDHRRYLTVTGKVYGEAKPICERTEALRELYGKYMAEKKPKSPTTVEAPRTPVSELDDGDLWDYMFSNPTNGGEIRSLYYGDTSGHVSQSQADLALCNHLAYYTGNDASRIDGMFRQSGLMRSKWDEKHSGTGETYGAMTIRKAIAGTTTTYDGSRLSPSSKPKTEKRPQGGGVAGTVTEQPAEMPEIRYITCYLEKSLEADIGRVQRYATRKTGYSNLDAKTSLYPGLYVLGSVSSLGKTTFCAQMADQLARAGEHVLYFSLEQTTLELITKGIARLTAQESFTEAVSAIEIRSGRITDSVRRAIAEYKRFATREAIIECNFMTTIDIITATVREYMSRTGTRPIVLVDYLQLIRPLDKRQTTKDAVDEHVRALKQLQMENDLVIVLISSLNRQNYLTTLDYEAFKESGGIEYTADVIWGLQLQVMNSEVFDQDKKLKTKRELVREAKRANPRRIELLCLKNRYGVANYMCNFDYYAKYDLFVPVEEQEAPENDVLEGIMNGNKRKRF